jgi:hypothetical protein
MGYNASAVQRSRDADLYAHLAEVDNMVETKCDYCKKEECDNCKPVDEDGDIEADRTEYLEAVD